jgi:hypothetical protein
VPRSRRVHGRDGTRRLVEVPGSDRDHRGGRRGSRYDGPCYSKRQRRGEAASHLSSSRTSLKMATDPGPVDAVTRARAQTIVRRCFLEGQWVV